MLSLYFLTEVRLFTLQLFDFCLEFLNLLSPLFLLRLAYFNVLFYSFEGDFQLSPYFCKFLLLSLILLFKQSLTVKEGFVIFYLYSLFFSSLYLFVACFQQFCPITFDFLQLTDDVKEILTTLSDFFFWPEGVWLDTLEGARTLSTFIRGLLMYIKFIIRYYMEQFSIRT